MPFLGCAEWGGWLCWVQGSHIALACPQLTLAKQDIGTPQKCFSAPEQTDVTVLRAMGKWKRVDLKGCCASKGLAGEAAFVLVSFLSWSGCTTPG